VSDELLKALPTGLNGLSTIGMLKPGMTGKVTLGGSADNYIDASQSAMTFHGKGGNGSFFIQDDCMRVANMEQNGGTGYITEMTNVDQVVVETGGLTAESQASSVIMNMVPKNGGNIFKGYQATRSAPLTSRLLPHIGAGAAISHWPNPRQPEVGSNDISILDTSPNFLYNAFFNSALNSGYGVRRTAIVTTSGFPCRT
jgi:hypothetical protein